MSGMKKEWEDKISNNIDGYERLLKELSEIEFKEVNKVFFNNYPNGPATLFNNIKQGYERHVRNGSWGYVRYRDVVIMIAAHRKIYSKVAIEMYGKKWGTKEFSKEFLIESRKYKGVKKYDNEFIGNETEDFSDIEQHTYENQRVVEYVNNDLGVNDMTEKSTSTKAAEAPYLGERMSIDNIEYTDNNLIISPVGSGKTYYMLKQVARDLPGKKLLLVSIVALKDSVMKEDGTYDTKEAQKARRNQLDITDENVYVMTYSEFGSKMMFHRNYEDSFANEFDVIFCDEIHSLFQYYMTHRTPALYEALTFIYDKHNDKKIFQFTATIDKIEEFMELTKDKNFLDRVNIVDYSKEEDIRKYESDRVVEYVGEDGLVDVVSGFTGIKTTGKKILIFNERIDGMKRIEELLEKKGLRAISLWSVNNRDCPMNEEQLKVREQLLNDGKFSEDFDVLIINEAMREGWNLRDERFQHVILNTTDKTNRVQALGRCRFNTTVVYVRVEGELDSLDVRIMRRELTTGAVHSVLGMELSKEDKNNLVEKLNILNERGVQVKWPTIKKTLVKSGYEVEDDVKRVDGKAIRFSIITKTGETAESTEKAEVAEVKVEEKSNGMATELYEGFGKSEYAKVQFIKNLSKVGFDNVNREFLDSYLNKGSSIAFSNIKSAYGKLVDINWTERKIVDITYMLARDSRTFSARNYINYGKEYDNKVQDVDYKLKVLSVRAMYEPRYLSQYESYKADKLAEKASYDEMLIKEANISMTNALNNLSNNIRSAIRQ